MRLPRHDKTLKRFEDLVKPEVPDDQRYILIVIDGPTVPDRRASFISRA